MEGWGKIGVQSASVLYPNSCYNESCYIEVQVYELFLILYSYFICYFQVNFHPDTYFENVLENIRGIAISNLQLFHQPVDKSMYVYLSTMSYYNYPKYNRASVALTLMAFLPRLF